MCLEINAHHLSTLAISFFWSFDLKSSCLDGVVGMRYIRDSFALSRKLIENRLPALRDLCLRRSPLPTTLKTSQTCIFSNLHTLRLQDCEDTSSFLEILADSGQKIQLRALELAFPDLLEPSGVQGIIKFLNAFEGLQELFYLAVDVENFSDSIASGILHHQSSLRRLVYHERQTLFLDNNYFDSYEGDADYRHELDLRSLNINPDQDVASFARAELRQLLSKCHLKCLGLCERPEVLVKTFLSGVSHIYENLPVQCS